MSERTSSEQRSRRETRGTLGLRIAAGIILFFSLVVLIQAIRIGLEGGFGPEGSGFFPLIVTVGLVFFSVMFFLRATVWPEPTLRKHVSEESEKTNWKTVSLAVICLLVYAFALAPLGYLIATTVFFPVVARVFGSRRWIRDSLIGLAASVILFVSFTQFLGVRLPTGVLGIFF